MVKSFKEFLEAEDQHPLMTSLKDVLGIDPEQLRREPQVATFWRMGLGTNLGAYKIIQFKRNSDGIITHAVVRKISSDKTYKDKDGKLSKVPNPGAEGDKLVAISDLDALMQQDFKTSGQV